jgi:hypothetical protein
LATLIKIVNCYIEVASAIGRENDSLGEWLKGRPTGIYARSSLGDYVLSLQTCPAEGPAKRSDAATAGTTSGCEKDAYDG